MDISLLSDIYLVRKLREDDAPTCWQMLRRQELFYLYHPPMVTVESILADMRALPPGKGVEDKYFVGFYQDDTLVAILDLIDGYPRPDVAFIGFFAVNPSLQGCGVGSKVITRCASFLKENGVKRIRLGVDAANPQSNTFWRKNGFTPIGEESSYIMMERML